MPHINRVRVNNVKYNFGTQYYDDFLMRFSGKNTIYDLANGGGKSVLMLLLLQNLIPNCTLDEKQPIEKLFRTSSGSKTIHSLIEWRLNDCDVKENYKYMLTGFCARKAKDDSLLEEEENRESANIEYFNYCIFYREFNDNDIKNLPLSNGKERITYNGLKAYLREIEKKDLSLKVYIFERKGEYQRFIADYGLYESEWEIIRGINKTEGHVRTYFETNYKTTRKVVEDLLIEEIIKKSFNTRTVSEGSDDVMAKTLIDIKDKLLDLSKRKDEIASLDREVEMIGEFAKRIQLVKELYFGRNDLSEEIIKGYYTIKKAISDRELDKLKLEEEMAELSNDAKTHMRQIETVKVQKEIKDKEEIIYNISVLEEKLKAIEVKYKGECEKLSLRECVNDYCDYIYYKKERDEQQILVDNIMRDKGEIVLELKQLAFEKAKRNEIEIQKLKAHRENEKITYDKEKESIKSLNDELDEMAKESAVYEYLIKNSEEQFEISNKALAEKKQCFDDVLSFDVNRQKREIETVHSKNLHALEIIQAEQENALAVRGEIKANLDSLVEDISKNDALLSDNIDERDSLARAKEKAEKLLVVYGEKDITTLSNVINQKFENMNSELSQLKLKLKQRKSYFEELQKGLPVPKEEELMEVFDYIVRYHGKVAVLGEDFIQEISKDERKELLSRNPLIPYGIIIKENYHSIIADTKLKDLIDTGYAIPLIRYDGIKENAYAIDSSNISFIMSGSELFFEDEKLEKLIDKVKEEISNMEYKADSIAESISLLNLDSQFVKEYVDIYFNRIEAADKLYEELKEKRKQLEALYDSKQEKLAELEKQIKEAEIKINDCKEMTEKSEKRLLLITEICELSSNASKVSDELQRNKGALKEVVSKKATLEARNAALLNQMNERRNLIDAISLNITKIEEDFEENYRRYFVEDMDVSLNLDSDELSSRFMGLKQAAECNNADVADKIKLINNYDVAMVKSLQAIDYHGVDVEKVKELYETGQIVKTENEKLKEIKAYIDGIKFENDNLTKEIAKLHKQNDRMEGSIDHGRRAVIDKYGEFEEINVENNAFEEYICAKNLEISKIDEKIKYLKDSNKDFEESTKRYAILERDIEKIVLAAGVNVGSEERLFAATVDIEEKVANIVEKYDKFLKEMYDKRDEFDREKRMLVDVLSKLGAEKLADEIELNAVMPKDVIEADNLMSALFEINECITLEKERIVKSIDDMEKIKSSFENQCVQTCINIKTELDRLPKLSKIFMDNETISIIGLSIPYVKEEEYKANMERHIDEIVKTVDTIRNDQEKIKYIKNQLSFKRLFSVIVTDMNSIKLTLYKRERIKEQSRYLKYEEAVGSTGQSQGIYIQFLVAIINYITSINSKSSDGLGLRKVVFIDNPFGAAKDVYIWEPIFKLLKTNNVQLVVPCRGATPAITGRFDVNYILGQKLVAGRQQTVVVDYCSNVDNEQMDYTTLSYEQTSLFS